MTARSAEIAALAADILATPARVLAAQGARDADGVGRFKLVQRVKRADYDAAKIYLQAHSAARRHRLTNAVNAAAFEAVALAMQAMLKADAATSLDAGAAGEDNGKYSDGPPEDAGKTIAAARSSSPQATGKQTGSQ